MSLFSNIAPRTSLSPDALIAVLVSLGAGVLVALMVRLNATLGVHMGVVASSWVVHVVGTLFAVLLWGLRAMLDARRPRSVDWTGIPWYAWTGGVLGVAIVALANAVVPALGLALTLSVVIATSLTVSALADHFGWFGLPVQPMTWQRALGIGCIVAGVVCVTLG
jgi:transporter family-2 protein